MAALNSCTSEVTIASPSFTTRTPQVTASNNSRVISAPPTPSLTPIELHTIPNSCLPVDLDDPDMAFPPAYSHARHAYSTNNNSGPPPAPIVLLLHGAWHTPSHYFPLLHALTTAGFLTLCPQLPSCSNITPPPCSLAEDANMIRSLAQDLADRGHPIIALMHSYGGMVGTEALAGLGWHAREQGRTNGDRNSWSSVGGVVALVYMTAFMLPVGCSLASLFGGELPPFMGVHPDGTCTMKDPFLRFYSTDVTQDQAKSPTTLSIPPATPCLSTSFLVTQLTHHPTSAQTIPISRAAYLDPQMSTTYLICENDMAIVPEGQRGMIQMVRAGGVKVHEETCKGGHSPFLSVPGDVAAVVDRAWHGWVNGEDGATDSVRSDTNGAVHETADESKLTVETIVAEGLKGEVDHVLDVHNGQAEIEQEVNGGYIDDFQQAKEAKTKITQDTKAVIEDVLNVKANKIEDVPKVTINNVESVQKVNGGPVEVVQDIEEDKIEDKRQFVTSKAQLSQVVYGDNAEAFQEVVKGHKLQNFQRVEEDNVDIAHDMKPGKVEATQENNAEPILTVQQDNAERAADVQEVKLDIITAPNEDKTTPVSEAQTSDLAADKFGHLKQTNQATLTTPEQQTRSHNTVPRPSVLTPTVSAATDEAAIPVSKRPDFNPPVSNAAPNNPTLCGDSAKENMAIEQGKIAQLKRLLWS